MKTSSCGSPVSSRRTGRSSARRAIARAIASTSLGCELLETRVLLSAGLPVVAVLDSGVNNVNVITGHIWSNPKESLTPVGADADANGFPNDLQGWDFASTVTADANGNGVSNGTAGTNVTTDGTGTGLPHGTNMAQAVLNASISVSIPGASQILIMPVKISTTHSLLNVNLTTGASTLTGGGPSGNVLGAPTAPDVLAAGINYAVLAKIKGEANVVAMTLDMGGISSSNPINDPQLFNLRNAIKNATDHGIVLLMGAGNFANNNDIISNYPANFAYQNDLVVPVAATDSTGNLLGASNYGPNSVRLGAPGLVTVTNPAGTNPVTVVANGSEFAAAEVAGAIGGLIASHPDLTPRQALAIVTQSLTPNATLQGRTVTGGAMLNFTEIALLGLSLPPVGAIETLTNSSVSGYVYDVDSIFQTGIPGVPPTVTLVIDGNTVQGDLQSGPIRTDIFPFMNPANNPLNLNIPTNATIAGNFSFSFGPLLAGPHTVSIYARDIPSNTLVLVASRSLNTSVPTLVLNGPNGQQIVQNQAVDFGNVTQGSQVDRTFTVLNTGNQPLSVFTPTLPAGYTLIKNVSSPISPGHSDTFTIRLDSSTSGLFNGPVTVNSNDPNGLSLVFNITGAVGASFITNLYETLFHRAPDIAGLAYWGQQLASGNLTTTQVAADFVNSTEYHTVLVENLYSTLLHRPGDPGGLRGWVDYLDGGGDIAVVRISFLSSGEYYAVHGLTAQAVVAAWYQDIFGRDVDASGLAAWSGQLLSGAPNMQVVTSLYYAPEGISHTVDLIYLTYLGRTADIAGQMYWSNQLATFSSSELQMAASLLGSQEFFIKP